MSAQSHTDTFSANFYVKNCLELAKRVVGKFLTCSLNSPNYNQKTSGSSRTDELNANPGQTIYMDCIYLNTTDEGYKFCVVFVDRVTSYITAIPLKALQIDTVMEAIRIFLAIMPFPREFKSDLGPEFGLRLTTELSRYGISHVGLLPNRSNQQGNVEIAIKLLRTLLDKIVSIERFGGRQNWTVALPAVIKALNESHAYNSPLSRSSLFFSPLHHANPALVLSDPFLMQKNVLDRLNLKRIEI